jgi:hypothetical protein
MGGRGDGVLRRPLCPSRHPVRQSAAASFGSRLTRALPSRPDRTRQQASKPCLAIDVGLFLVEDDGRVEGERVCVAFLSCAVWAGQRTSRRAVEGLGWKRKRYNHND